MKRTLVALLTYKRADLLQSDASTLRHFRGMLEQEDLDFVVFTRDDDDDRHRIALVNTPFTRKDINAHDIVSTRDAVLNYARQNGYEYLIMLDDDMTLSKRADLLSLPRILDNVDDTLFMLRLMVRILEKNEDVAMCGPLARAFIHSFGEEFVVNHRIIQYLCFDLSIIEKEKLRFASSKMMYMTDFWMNMKLLTLGYKTVGTSLWLRDDQGLGKPGGCFNDRTTEKMNASAKELKRQFPDFITLRWKENYNTTARSTFVGEEKPIQVTANWKKAYASCAKQ